MSKRGKALIAIALAAGVLLVPALTVGTSNGSINIINDLRDDTFINSLMIINNSISSNDIKNNSISSIDIRNNSIAQGDLAAGVLTMRGYGKVLGGSLVANASRNLTVRKPDPEVMCVAVNGVADASRLAPQLTPIDAWGDDGSRLETSNPMCHADEFPIMLGLSKDFTLLVL